MARTTDSEQYPPSCRQMACCNMVFTIVTITLLVLALWLGHDGHKDKIEYPKPFGLGIGPSFYGGSDMKASDESYEFAWDIYYQYMDYKKLVNTFTEEDQLNIERWVDTGECLGSCIENSFCRDGYCFCDPEQDKIPVFGQCWDRSSGFLKEVSDTSRYRKEIAPSIPRSCYIEVKEKDKKGKWVKKEVMDPKQKGTEKCTQIVFPNVFNHDNLTCGRSDHRHCQTKDRNMFCQEDGKCGCRHGMKFNTDWNHMECEFFLDVDCSEETPFDFVDGDEEEILKTITDDIPIEKNKYELDKVKKVFCVHLDSLSSKYNALHEEKFTLRIMGLNMLGFGVFIVFCFFLLFTGCMWINIIQKCVRYMDPNNIIEDMDEETKMAAMASLAGTEYMERQEEKRDEVRTTQMQGGYPVQ